MLNLQEELASLQEKYNANYERLQSLMAQQSKDGEDLALKNAELEKS